MLLKLCVQKIIIFSKLKQSTVFTTVFLLFSILICQLASAQKPKIEKPKAPVYADKTGKLLYTPDSLGNRIPDFSYCGYQASEKMIPNVPVKVIVPLKEGDATLRIQSAIDYVASLPADQNGLRGAVLLVKGTYHILGSLKFNASGVVLRGSGMNDNGTILSADGTDRNTLLIVAGTNNRKLDNEVKITNQYVPVNAFEVNVADANSFKVGDQVLIKRPSTQAWIEKLGTETFGGGISSLGWKPGQRDIFWDRKILTIKNSTITFDAPITTALDAKYGGGVIIKYNWPGRIRQIGIENLRCVSAFDPKNPKDEAHRWMAITMENVEDAWVRRVVFEHFAGSAVDLLSTTKRISVEDCKSLAPVSEIGGQRRYTFWTTGQQTLFQRLYSDHGYHDFAVGYRAAGPNAFVQCQSDFPYSYSGSIDSWASGVLFDVIKIDAQALSYKNLGQDEQGAGWNAANSLFWNCAAALVDCYQPPTAQNWAFGTWAQFQGDGYWGDSNNWIEPRSFFYAQLKDRLVRNVDEQAQILPMKTDASSSPTVEVAAELTAESTKPALTMEVWMDKVVQNQPIPISADHVKTIDQIGFQQPQPIKKSAVMQVKNGWLVRGNEILAGKRSNVPWWSGSVHSYYLDEAKSAITRYVPGRIGTGLTDDLDSVANRMVASNTIEIEQNYGLWYDRRRDDHERIRRMNGDVWPPFYELPFARSGEGLAWDGLSKYDLTKYNHFYWGRLKEFADLADEKGLVLIHHNYFQHNIIEAGAHYVDFPWRPANNINNTGFPEPVPFAGDKRLFMAEQFYDETNPARRKLHQAFIRQCLQNFVGNNGVIQFIAEEFTGPLHFVQFWIDTILGWEKETGHKEMIGLSTTKDVQDAILADPKRAAVVNVIDIRYWYYQADGTAYAPLGGQNLAPRQQARQFKPKATSFEQVYRAVREYRDRYPDKAVMFSADGYDHFGWAAFMAGGSLAVLPAGTDTNFLRAASNMHPIDIPGNPKEQWALSDGKNYIVYTNSAEPVHLDLADDAMYSVIPMKPQVGKAWGEAVHFTGKTLKSSPRTGSKDGEEILWFKRDK